MGTVRRAIPHVREFLADSLTPLGVYRRLARTSPVRFLFESVTGGEQVSRFSFLGAGPREILRLYPDRLEVERLGELGRGAGSGDVVDASHFGGSKAAHTGAPARPSACPASRSPPSAASSPGSPPSPARSPSPAASSASSATT